MTALTRLIASTPFRLTVAYMGGFVVAAALIVGFVAWQANELLTSKVIEALSAEISALREQFQAGGPERLVAAVKDRVAQPGPNLYLVLDATGRKLAGNLPALPPELAQGGQGMLFTHGKRAAVGEVVQVRGGLTLGGRPRHRGSAPVRAAPWAGSRCGASACCRRSAWAPAS